MYHLPHRTHRVYQLPRLKVYARQQFLSSNGSVPSHPRRFDTHGLKPLSRRCSPRARHRRPQRGAQYSMMSRLWFLKEHRYVAHDTVVARPSQGDP